VVPLAVGLVVLVVALVVVGAIVPRRRAAELTPQPARARHPERPSRRPSNPLAPPKPARAGGYEWDRRTHQLYRAWKRVPGPDEQHGAIAAFIDAHAGVEAFVEPRTVMHPLSVVLVDADGAWARFEMKEDAYLRELARERGVPVFDASRVGYPPRMRRRRPDEDEDEDRA